MTRVSPFSSAIAVILVGTGALPAVSAAGGVCILHPQPFKLQSDAVRWSIRVRSGDECIQGLRWSTIMIDNISVVRPPKSGRLVIQGPAFRYFAGAASESGDSFKITISGTSLHVNGTSTIDVDVTSR